MPTREEFEAAILARPDAPEPYAVYGDWLQAHGDPRGELIAIQARMSQVKDSAQFLALKAIEKRLLEVVQLESLPVPPHLAARVRFEWRWGFVHGMTVLLLDDSFADELMRLVSELLSLPLVRFLQAFRVESTSLRGFADEVLTRVEQRPPPLLKRLTIGGGTTRLRSLRARFPQLEALTLSRGLFDDAAAIDFPELRVLTLEYVGTSEGLTEVLERAPWPKLKTLTLALDELRLTPKKLVTLPTLTSVTLRPTDLLALVARQNLSALKDVVIHGEVEPRELEVLLSRAGALSGMSLRIFGGRLPIALVRRLRATLKSLELGTAVRIERPEDDDPGTLVMSEDETRWFREAEAQRERDDDDWS